MAWRNAGVLPLTVEEEFPGWDLLLGDPYNPDSAYRIESDRGRWPDTSPARNCSFMKSVSHGAASPFRFAVPSVVAVDGYDVPSFNSTTHALAGWLTGATAGGDNLLAESEAMSAGVWVPYTDGSGTGVTLSAGPTPPAPYTESTTITENNNAQQYHLIIQTPATSPFTYYRAGEEYEVKCCAKAGAGAPHFFLQVDNYIGKFIDLATGTLGTTWLQTGATTLDGFHVTDKSGGWWELMFRVKIPSAAASHPIRLWLCAGDATYNAPYGGRSLHVTGAQVSPVRTLTEPRPYVRSNASPIVGGTAGNDEQVTVVTVSKMVGAGDMAIFDSVANTLGTNTGPMIGREAGTRRARHFRQAGVADLFYGSSNDTAIIMQVATAGPGGAGNAKFWERTTLKDSQSVVGTGIMPRFVYTLGCLLEPGYIAPPLWALNGQILFVGRRVGAVDATWVGNLAAKLGAKFTSMAP